MKCLVVTGGCGFIGSNFIRDQISRYPEQAVVNIDKLTYAGNPENLADIESNPRYGFKHGDICDREFVRAVLKSAKPDAIVNFAAESHVDRSILDSGPFIQTNVIGTQILLDCCREAKAARFTLDRRSLRQPGCRRFVHRGDADCSQQPLFGLESIRGPLGASVFSYVRLSGVITRRSNNYGPYQFPEKIIPLFISRRSTTRRSPSMEKARTSATGFMCSTTAGESMPLCVRASPGRFTTLAVTRRSGTSISLVCCSSCSENRRR